MQKAMKVVVGGWVLMAPLLALTTHALDFPFNPEDLLWGPSILTRSGAASPPCTTPEGQQGECIRATTCQPYQPLLKDLRKHLNATVLLFFRERVCRQVPDAIDVCCPFEEPPQGPPRGPFLEESFTASPQRSPSQRPNGKRPAQSDFREVEEEGEEDETREFLPPPPPPARLPAASFQPQPPPTRRATTTTPPPLRRVKPHPPLPSSMGTFLRPDRGPVIPDLQNNSTSAPLTEPPVPAILPSECGVLPKGTATSVPLEPWVVGLGYLNQAEYRMVCGGALISNLHVIAAAHCMHTFNPTHVRLGDLVNRGASNDVQIHAWHHPDFQPASRDNDVALLTLSSPVIFADNIRPVCLPFQYRLDGFQGQHTQVVGWNGQGHREAGIVQVIGLSKCRQAYQSPSPVSNNKLSLFSQPSFRTSFSSPSLSITPRLSSSVVVVDRRHLCGSPASSAVMSDICLSDHGSPLFYHDLDTTGLHFLVGVSSRGEGCEAGPALYTRIGAFLPWLVKQLSTAKASAPSPSLTRSPELTLRRQRS